MEKTNMKRMFEHYYIIKICLAVTVAAVLFGTGCATIPEKNAALDRARAAYERAAADPNVEKNEPVALYEADQTLKKAEAATDVKEMEYLSYIAEKKAQIATVQTEEKLAEKEMDGLTKEKEKIVLQARELEAKQAMSLAEQRAREAELARKEAEEKAREAEKAKSDALALAQQAEKSKTEAEARALQVQKAKSEAEAKTLEAEKAKKEAEAGKLEAEAARLKAEEAMAQKKQMESELAELKAKQTEKGIVLTLGDILFETGKSMLMPGAMHSIDILVDFLKKYPERNVLIEGFTDSRGGETYNLGLSQRRADSVRDALIGRGIPAERITAKGYGERFPVATNSTSAGRQQNRRVEITILEEGVSPEKMSR
jgi:outer membrane protein OmpA-like peptidoglycan-associated protein